MPNLGALFRFWTPMVFECPVIAGFSVNIEEVVKGVIPNELLVGRSKVTVRKITAPLGREGTFRVLPIDTAAEQVEGQMGEQQQESSREARALKVFVERVFSGYAGSSANIRAVIEQLQKNQKPGSRTNVGIIGTAGRGNSAASLRIALRDDGAQFGLVGVNGTNTTVTLQSHQGQQVLVCEKNDWDKVPNGLLRAFIKANPMVLVFTGIREATLALVEDIFKAYIRKNKHAFRVFSPHLDVLDHSRPNLIRQVRAVIAKSDVLSISKDEALRLVADKNIFGDEDPFDSKNEEHINRLVSAVAALGASITMVTLDVDGVVVAQPGGVTLRHKGYPPPKGVRDTGGAGDAFLASFLYFYVISPHRRTGTKVNTDVLLRSVALAQIVAAWKVSGIGSTSNIPTIAQVLEYYETVKENP